MSSVGTKSSGTAKGKKRAASPTVEQPPAGASSTSDAQTKTDSTDTPTAPADEPTFSTRASKRAKKETTPPVEASKPKRGRPTASASAPAAAASSSNSHTPLTLSPTFASFGKGDVGEVFAIGSGDCSQLGLGPDEEMRERKKPTLLTTLTEANVSVRAIAAGSLHNLIIDSKHAVWSWGCNDDHALGRETDEWLPERVVGPLGKGGKHASVVQIACGASHSLALTQDGEVYCFGTFRDANGVIGFSETIDAAKEPMKMSFGAGTKQPTIVMIAAGEHHDLALTENGEVFQWGDIGIGRRFSDRKKKTKLTPSRVVFKKSGSHPAPKRIVKVFAGGHSSYALDEEGLAWFWGPNNYNQSGLPNEDKDSLMILTPTPVAGLPKLKKVACATHHSLFLTVDGQVYSTGRGEDGRLGHGDMENKEKPTLIADLAPEKLGHGDHVEDINCGECHSLIVTSLGRLYSFGYGDLLQLGNGVEEDVGSPLRVASKELDHLGAHSLGRKVIQAAGGSQHSILLAVARSKKAPWADDLPTAMDDDTQVAAKSSEPKKMITDMSQFLAMQSGWECSACMVQNKESATRCAACETPKDGAPPASSSSAASSGPINFGTPQFNFGGAPAAAAGISFGAAAPAAAGGGFSFSAAPAASTSGVSFGASTDTPSFGTAPPAAPSGGFSFGGAAPAAGGFSFGAAPASDSAMKD